MNKILVHEALALELELIIKEAPYPSLGTLNQRLDVAQSKHSHGFNPGYEREKFSAAVDSVRRFLTAKGVTDERRRQFALQDVSKIRNLKSFRNLSNISSSS